MGPYHIFLLVAPANGTRATIKEVFFGIRADSSVYAIKNKMIVNMIRRHDKNNLLSLVCALVIVRSKSVAFPNFFWCTMAFFRSETDMCKPSNVMVS